MVVEVESVWPDEKGGTGGREGGVEGGAFSLLADWDSWLEATSVVAGVEGSGCGRSSAGTEGRGNS
jgi:hypothetical protein